jgi:enamine deaminase RidA (YjgF/YER057c/UK114 family)
MQRFEVTSTMPRTTKAVLPVHLPRLGATLARGIRAGRWLFASGLNGAVPGVGLTPAVTGGGNPLAGEPACKREARALFANAREVLAAEGLGFPDCVRIDQYYVGAHAVDPYHEVRREIFGGRIPPSTSNLHRAMAYAGQTQEVQLVAAVPSGDFRAEHLKIATSWSIHASSGYSPALAAGEFLFVPGQTAEARDTALGPLDPEARMPHGHLWKGTPIKLETNFIVERKLKPSLAAAGATLDDVVKAQVYLRDRADVPAFTEAWRSHFAVTPVTTIIPTATPGFIVADGRIEINTISVRQKAAERIVEHDATVAVRAGDLLFLSGLMASDANGLLADMEDDARAPFTAIPIKDQVRAIAARAQAICRQAGADLANVVRLQLFLTDLSELAPAIEAWSNALDGLPLPLSAIEVNWLAVPGARILADIWVHAP